MCSRTCLILCSLSLLCIVTAHPGSDHVHLKHKRNSEEHARSKRALSACMTSRAVRSAEETRQAWFRNRVKRDKATILAMDHRSSAILNVSDNPFTGKASCLLNPEGELGPYWVKGELIRSDLRDGQAGIPLYLDFLVIDVGTCQPVRDVYLDIWGCNSTGVYAGIQAYGNGNYDDAGNMNKTFGRGLQPTSNEGTARFTTTFPGHYGGRTNHIHVIVHRNGVVLPNGTYTSGTMPHIGQILFDQSLIDTVEASPPYNINRNFRTSNTDDNVVNQETGTDSDPFVNYVLLGDRLSDGVFGWITLGIDPSIDHTNNSGYQAMLTESGGVKLPQSNHWFPDPCGGIGGGAASGNGRMPGGFGPPGGPGGPGGPPPWMTGGPGQGGGPPRFNPDCGGVKAVKLNDANKSGVHWAAIFCFLFSLVQ